MKKLLLLFILVGCAPWHPYTHTYTSINTLGWKQKPVECDWNIYRGWTCEDLRCKGTRYKYVNDAREACDDKISKKYE